MCTNYPKIIITSPKEPAAFCPVPQTVQENLLTTNYEQWCALYSMNDDDISLDYVSTNLKQQKLHQCEGNFNYNEEYSYEYDDFEDDDFFDKYQQPRHTLDYELNNYNETHVQKYESYDNREYCDYYNYYESEEEEEGFDHEFDYESDDYYDDEEVFYMEKEPDVPKKPRLNYDILANAISRRFNKTTDSDVSEESEEEDTVEAKIVVKKTPSIITHSNSLKNRHNLYTPGIYEDEEDNSMFDYMETINKTYSKKEISSSLPNKSGFSIMNDIINESRSFGMPEAISNKHGSRDTFLTHRKSSSLQGSLIEKTLNNNLSSLLKKDSGIILNGPMKNRKRAFSLNERNEFRILKSSMNDNSNKIEFNEFKKSIRLLF